MTYRFGRGCYPYHVVVGARDVLDLVASVERLDAVNLTFVAVQVARLLKPRRAVQTLVLALLLLRRV